ncbi:AI-2E family transporter [Bradyrhizobium sp. USDA 10063]
MRDSTLFGRFAAFVRYQTERAIEKDNPLGPQNLDWLFFRRLLQVAAVVGLVVLIWQLTFILLLVFASILVATLLSGLADALMRHASLTRRWALAAVIVGFALLAVGFLVLFGARLTTQLINVFERAPGAIDAAGEWMGISNAADRATQALTQSGVRHFSQAATAGYALLGGVGQLLLVVIGAIYLTANPLLYRDGFAKLFPIAMQERIVETMGTVASALRLWFVGQSLSMLLVGTMSALAFWLIGLPIPLGLGAIAGVTNFVPIVGPILGSMPAVLFAFTIDIGTVAWATAAIVLIQQIEGYIGTPLIQRQVVALPPALLLFSLVALGALFGWLGIILAAPLTVTVMVLVQKLWVRGVIGEKVNVVGEAVRRR